MNPVLHVSKEINLNLLNKIKYILWRAQPTIGLKPTRRGGNHHQIRQRAATKFLHANKGSNLKLIYEI